MDSKRGNPRVHRVDRRSLPQKLEARSKRSLVNRACAFFETERSQAVHIAALIRGQFRGLQVDTITSGPFAFGVVVVTNNYKSEVFGEIFDQIRSLSEVKAAFRCAPGELFQA